MKFDSLLSFEFVVTKNYSTPSKLCDTSLEGAVVPAGPINTVAEALENPQILHRKMLIEPEGIPGLRTPITFSRSEQDNSSASPKLDRK